jgi:hypothetical protein
MNNNIDNILNSYFEGSALPEEERQLKEYFRSNTVLPEHEVYKPLFAAFDRERQIAAPQFEVPASKKSKPRLSKVLWSAVAGAAAIYTLYVVYAGAEVFLCVTANKKLSVTVIASLLIVVVPVGLSLLLKSLMTILPG